MLEKLLAIDLVVKTWFVLEIEKVSKTQNVQNGTGERP
jgi:hypothetical protein